MHDRDRERDAVHAGESRCVVVLRVLLHREDAGLRLADALALEEVRVDARGVVDPAARELLRHLPRPFLVGLDQAYADPLRVEHPRDRGADLAAPVHDHVLHRARARGEERAPRACRLGRADHDDPVAVAIVSPPRGRVTESPRMIPSTRESSGMRASRSGGPTSVVSAPSRTSNSTICT